MAGNFGGDLGGNTATFGEGDLNQTTLTSEGLGDIWVARYHPDGTLRWAKGAGGTMSDFAFGLAAEADGTTVLTGYFRDRAVFGRGEANETFLDSAGQSDVFVAKYTADGTLVWAVRAGGQGDDVGFAASVLPDGSAIAVGNFPGTATFGPGEPNETVLTSAGGFDIFIAKYDPDGRLAWARRAGGSFVGAYREDNADAIASIADGSFVVTGSFDHDITLGPGEPNETSITSAGEADMFLARYQPDGTLDWVRHAGGSDYDSGIDVVLSTECLVYVLGSFDSDIIVFGPREPKETTLTAIYHDPMFIAKYLLNGSIVWAKGTAGTGNSQNMDKAGGIRISLRNDGMSLVTGYLHGVVTFGPGERNQTTLTAAEVGNPARIYSPFVAEFNPDGTLSRVDELGSPSSTNGYGIAALVDGSSLVAGTFIGYKAFTSDDGTEFWLESEGYEDIFLIRLRP